MQTAALMGKIKQYAGSALAVVVASAVSMASLPASNAGAEPAGLNRAREQRVADVVRMKNDFVRRLLDKNGIAYRLDKTGIVIELRIDDRWQPVKRTEIVPVVSRDDRGGQIVAHEVYFYTLSDVYRLVSDLTIR
ncbi:MAG: hypothetical protein JW950_06375 [Deltaproteobacteria bacterium]|nr:hypothetical protein [Deltaproteobacteria bacterium]